MLRPVPLTAACVFAACTVLAHAAAAQAPPRLSAGLWEIRTEMPGRRHGTITMTIQRCLDDATQRTHFLPEQISPEHACRHVRHRRDGGAYVTEADCTRGGSAVKATFTTTLKGARAYRTEARFAYDPPYRDVAVHTMTMDGRLQGACPANMQPGEVRLPGVTDVPEVPEVPPKK